MDQLISQSIYYKIENLLQVSKQSQQYSDEDLILKVMQISKPYYNDKILRHQGKGSKKICSAPIPKGTLYFKCFECSKEMTHVYCEACFIKEKHLNHVVTYHYSNGGCCDCGDTLIMNKESFCNKHQSKIVQIHNPQKELGEQFVKQYEEFIMMAFGLLYNLIDQIVDYPSNFINFIQLIQRDISDAQINLEISKNLNKFLDQRNVLEDMIRVYKMIFRVLKKLTQNNILISFLTSQCLQKPINQEIQKHLPLRHAHYQDKFQQFKLLNKPEECNCCILELYVKYNQFISQSQDKDEKNLEEMSEIFYELHVDDTFKQNLCQYILQYFNHLYRPYENYKVVSCNGGTAKIKINSLKYSNDSLVREILLKIFESPEIFKKKEKHGITSAGLFGYFYQFMGHIVFALLKLFRDTKNVKFYRIFDINAENLVQIPLCNDQSQFIAQKFDDMIVQQFYDETIKLLFQQMEEILEQDSNLFNAIVFDSRSAKFQSLQKSSLLIYALTRIYPCCQTEVTVFTFSQSDEQKKFISSQIIQVCVLSSFRNLLRAIFETWHNTHKNCNQGLQNISRLIIHYFLNNFINSFTLSKQNLKNQPTQKFESPLISFLKNQVLSDRNFISILAAYLVEFKETKDAYENLLELSGHSAEQFKQVMNHILKRTMLSFVALKHFGHVDFYCGKLKLYKENSKQSEISLESVDITYFQIYAFLFGSEGIQDIIECNQQICAVFDLKSDPTYLICRIALTDYDYFQTSYFSQYNELSEQFQRSLSKLFQTIFFAYAFQSQEELISILKQISFESTVDLQQIILSSCELNKDNDQLQLKKQLQPARYEPIFARQIPDLKDFINNKLRNQGDYFTELFGNSLEFELSDLANPKSTLTYKRLAILRAISNDQSQALLLKIVSIIQKRFQEKNFKEIERILEENSIYINLLFQANQYLHSENQVIVENLKKILKNCVDIIQDGQAPLELNSIFHSYVKLLDEKFIFLTQENDAHKAIRVQSTKKQYQLKFQKMSKIALKKEDIDTPTDIGTKSCSLCQLHFSCDESQYKAILIQKTNAYKYIQHCQELNKFSNFFSHHISSCHHSFHLSCLKDNLQKFYINNSQFLKCPICLQPQNFPLMNFSNLQNIQDEEIKRNLEFYLQTLNESLLEEYYKKFTINNELSIPPLLTELITQGLCGLLLSLLQDIRLFIQNQYHLILQSFVKLLQLAYKSGQQSLLNGLDSDGSLVMKFIILVDKYLIQTNNLLQYQIAIQQLFQINDIQLLSDVFNEEQFILQNKIIAPIINLEEIKAQLKNSYISQFKPNFKEFLISNLLLPCQKKKCNASKLPEYQKAKLHYEYQYFCLICRKKMCLYCRQYSMQKPNNLLSHCKKKHEGKSIFLLVQTGEIFIVTYPFYTLSKHVLYKNLIGEKPILNYQKSEYYQKFGLNVKAIDEILEIIFGEKYLNKLFINTTKVLRFE